MLGSNADLGSREPQLLPGADLGRAFLQVGTNSANSRLQYAWSPTTAEQFAHEVTLTTATLTLPRAAGPAGTLKLLSQLFSKKGYKFT